MKRINLFLGHYGSGKTNVAVNYALFLKKSGFETAIADIDIVNPYFRTEDSRDYLEKNGIEVISLPFANSNVDLPALPPEAYSLVQNRAKSAVFDVGGDDRGAYALGRYVPYIKEENNYEMFFVANFCRALTPDAESAYSVMLEIETACGMHFTSVVNNSNLGNETTAELIEKHRADAERLCDISGLPLAFTSVREDICEKGDFPIKLQRVYY